MIFTKTPLKDAFVIDLETLEDDRGFFARAKGTITVAPTGPRAEYLNMRADCPVSS